MFFMGFGDADRGCDLSFFSSTVTIPRQRDLITHRLGEYSSRRCQVLQRWSVASVLLAFWHLPYPLPD